jgi:hypothetical protein
MNLTELERILRQSAASLAETITFYRAPAGSELLEANIVMHLGRGLLSGGFLTCANPQGRGHTDLIAVHPAKSALVIAEVKRLDAHGGTGAGLYDRQRLATFMPQDGAQKHPGLKLDRRYGVFAGMSANREHARWFTTVPSGAVAPTPELAALQAQLPPDTIWNGYALCEVADAAGKRRTEWLLYAVFQMR